MAERNTAKIKRSEPVKAERKPTGSPAASEVVRLRAELAAALSRIAELEAIQNDAINRIDWVIDSLHNLSE
ncbi:MAG: hypothetical protein CTY31_02600 [Hyphomicrobium sp.]|jgi:hypothetical protein|nr:MAG: hypothetical protein CTY39_02980 [Hyphomicrobium sp.]PPD01658.1 MAG: hypothetical protein CTY31_02600 [Hyphomicrobium sp.]